MTIYVAINEDIKEKLKKGIYEPSIDCKNKDTFEGVKKFRSIVIQAYNKFNGTNYTDYMTGCSRPNFIIPYAEIYELKSPLLKRFLFPIYESEYERISLDMNKYTLEENIDRFVNAEKVYKQNGKPVIYVIPYIKSDWLEIR